MIHTRIGVNGFGRIGRMACRIACQHNNVEIGAINSRADSSSHAQLLRYDSTYGVFPHKVETNKGNVYIDGKKILVYQKENPADIPWEKARVDIVLEATGAFRSYNLAKGHLKRKVKKVIISAPPKDNIPTFCLGVNENKYDPNNQHIISNASCTTNCLAVVAKVLDDNFGIIKGFMTTVHSFTDSQNLLDNSHKKSMRLGRSAIQNIIPTETGASFALSLVIPQLGGKIISSSIRVPTATVSLIDLTVEVERQTDVESVNTAFRKAKGMMKGILDITDEPLVSSDFKGSPFSAIVDGMLTKVNGNMINVKAWYDNEWGYAQRLVELAVFLAKKGL